MNVYLEKIAVLTKEALNALRARRMAQQVGVIPDPSSAWKWGLRQLRDGRGNALTGDALERARIGMGAMSHKGFDTLRKAQESAPDREISYHTLKGNVTRIHVGGKRNVTLDINSYRKIDPNLDGYIGHTHHGVGFVSEGFVKHPHHITLPSGYHEHDIRWANDEYGRVYKKRLQDASYSTHLRQKLKEAISSNKITQHSAERIWDRHSPKTLSIGDAGRDIHHAIMSPNKFVNKIYRISNRSIANTTQGVEGLHRSVGVHNGRAEEAHLLKHRTVFLKHD
ncbi:MAG TPA: hypothetical protein VFM18_21160 [Methanosarcina sp.]|nr:hypothetical protein [Methanosarcina sp.]